MNVGQCWMGSAVEVSARRWKIIGNELVYLWKVVNDVKMNSSACIEFLRANLCIDLKDSCIQTVIFLHNNVPAANDYLGKLVF